MSTDALQGLSHEIFKAFLLPTILILSSLVDAAGFKYFSTSGYFNIEDKL
jgi:hypothetical protein